MTTDGGINTIESILSAADAAECYPMATSLQECRSSREPTTPSMDIPSGANTIVQQPDEFTIYHQKSLGHGTLSSPGRSVYLELLEKEREPAKRKAEINHHLSRPGSPTYGRSRDLPYLDASSAYCQPATSGLPYGTMGESEITNGKIQQGVFVRQSAIQMTPSVSTTEQVQAQMFLADSDNEGTEEAGARSEREQPLHKKQKVMQYRCAKYAANPGKSLSPRCKDWHNVSIAAVTRHSLRDADMHQALKIKALSTKKLPGQVRWMEYYRIFGGSDEEQIKQPYYITPGSTQLENKLADFLSSTKPGERSGDFMSYIIAMAELESKKKNTDEKIDAYIDHLENLEMAALRGRIASQRASQKAKSQAEYDDELQKLRRQFPVNSWQKSNEDSESVKILNARQALLDWLTPVDFGAQQRDLVGRRQAGTCTWFLHSNEFKAWLSERTPTLFCTGKPGAGKTIMTSTVVDHMQSKFTNDSNIGVAFLYGHFWQQQIWKPRDLLASLVKQLVQRRPSVPGSVTRLYQRYSGAQRLPSFDDLSAVSHSIFAEFSKCFIILDGLDELQESEGARQQFLSRILSIQAKTGANLFLTSRPIQDITSIFEGCVHREIRASSEDINAYLDCRIMRLPTCVSRSLELQHKIRTAILKANDEMFLMTQLHLDSLSDRATPKAITSALGQLRNGPNTYDRAYSEAMKRIEGQQQDFSSLAKQVLSWITCARRTLTTTELRHALAVEPDEAELDDENIPEIEDIVSVCAGLVTTDEESSIVRFMHSTVREYLTQTQALWFPNAETEIAKTCITYLSFHSFESGLCPTDELFEKRMQQYPLYDYAARNWGHHVGKASSEVHQLISEFLDDEAKISSSTQAMMISHEYYYQNYSQNVPRKVTGVHLAAIFGLEQTTTTLLEKGYDPDYKDSWGRTPLSWAAENGHKTIVRLLLEKGAKLESWDDRAGLTPLSLAAKNNHRAVVDLLLDKGAKLESQDYNRKTPLSLAAETGNETIVQLLLDKGAKLEHRNQYGLTPLFQAVSSGHKKVVGLLLDKGAELESQEQWGRTPLSWAAENGHEAVVRLLIDKGAELESQDDRDGRTPLSWAAQNGHEEVARLLIENRAKVESRDKYGRTPLSWGAEGGTEALVRLLVEKGSDIEVEDKYGRRPLSWAAERGNEAVVKLLIEKGVDLESKDKHGWTPLSWAVEGGSKAVVKALVEKGANVKVHRVEQFSEKLSRVLLPEGWYYIRT